jgi:hypothetical protein
MICDKASVKSSEKWACHKHEQKLNELWPRHFDPQL